MSVLLLFLIFGGKALLENNIHARKLTPRHAYGLIVCFESKVSILTIPRYSGNLVVSPYDFSH